ncbi:alpha/beta fold hydrolase [Paenibacillus filicis]|uniref:Alpha/beta fold hydrolase n=1 Tax=Paenibacillus gyeongsangnamensis TaxID=3388067 RepID=A0ABT4Q7I2_9BACL|nr:alpha/beta fold hydrolase [Paenibacillus filicis]MCZ8512791.1 alpha/beta fold hydrolase [Paenibacillus filicis]
MRATPAITRAPRRRSSWARWIWPLGSLIVFLLASSIGISIYVGWKLTHPVPKPLDDSPDHYGMSFESIQFQSRQGGILLKGWYIPGKPPAEGTEAPAKPNLILAHGYDNNRLQKSSELLRLAKDMTDLGYNVMMFDFRNAGESGGNLTSVGYYEKFDLLAAVDWMMAQHPGKLALVGYSMGASTALLTAAEDPAVTGVIADSPFNHLTHYLQDNLPVWSHLPNIPFTPLILEILPRLTGFDPDQVDALSAVDRIYPRPVLFIHSTDDTSMPYMNSESMWEKHKDRFEFWKTSGAGHAKSYPKMPKEYVEHLNDFLQKL